MGKAARVIEAKSKPMVTYICGPMSNVEDFNYPAFHSAAARWRTYGHTVLNPAEHFDGDTSLPYETYLRKAIHTVADAEAVAVLPGWQDSNGARLEVTIAKALGLPIYSAVTMEEIDT